MNGDDMVVLRLILGQLILFIDSLTKPNPIAREDKIQEKIDLLTSRLSLYQFNACPFCVRVRRQIRRQSLKIDLKDAKNDIILKEELKKEGGKYKVPCLRIDNETGETKWLYESTEIIRYLRNEFSTLS